MGRGGKTKGGRSSGPPSAKASPLRTRLLGKGRELKRELSTASTPDGNPPAWAKAKARAAGRNSAPVSVGDAACAPSEGDELCGGCAPGDDESERGKHTGRLKRFSQCLLCGADPAVAEWADSRKSRGKLVPSGPGCMECFKTWTMGNYLITKPGCADFKSFVQTVSGDATEKGAFLVANAIRTGKRLADFFPTEVLQQNNIGYEVSRKYIGMTRQQFIDYWERTPESLKVKLKDIENEQGKLFKGILMVDPNAPWVHYKTTRVVSSAMQDLKMPRQNQLTAQQGRSVFESAVGNQSKQGMMQKLRCTTMTDAEVRSLISAADADYEQPTGAADRSTACDNGSASEDSSDGISEEEGDNNGPGLGSPAPSVAPLLTAGSFTEDGRASKRSRKNGTPLALEQQSIGPLSQGTVSRLGETSPVAPRIPRSVSRRSLSGSVCGRPDVPEADDSSGLSGDLKTFNEHMAKLKTDYIWAGQKLGVQMRFAEKFNHSIEKNHPDSFYMLADRLEMCSAATWLMENDFTDPSKVSRTSLDDKVQTLKRGKVVIAPAVQVGLVRRRVKDLGELRTNSSTRDVQAVLRLCAPWTLSAASDSDSPDGEFDPTGPRMAAVVDSAKTKSTFFADTACTYLIAPLLKLGEAGEEAVLRINQ